MYNSGDAAEQVVRMSLEGAEFALKITGSAAKNLAAALYTVLKDQKKTKGKARIEAMLREKRPLKVYTIKKEDCPEFAKQAKGYGILYAPIPVKKGDDTIDILVFEDDAARANRIVEKFKLTVVDTASIKEDSFGDYEVIAAFKTVAYSEEGFKYYHFVRAEQEEDFDEFIAKCKELALYDTGVTAEYGDQLITLSTCEYSRTNGRMVVVAKLLEE